MYVSTNAGLGARRRRGFGDTSSTDTTGAPCPGSPGCPGYVAPGSTDWQNSILNEILANQQTSAAAQQTSTGTLTAWLNANSTMVALGAAGFVALLLFAKAGR